jgi:hypothetical protein
VADASKDPSDRIHELAAVAAGLSVEGIAVGVAALRRTLLPNLGTDRAREVVIAIVSAYETECCRIHVEITTST